MHFLNIYSSTCKNKWKKVEVFVLFINNENMNVIKSKNKICNIKCVL